MEVLAKRAITLKVSGVLGSPFVSMLLATYKLYDNGVVSVYHIS